MNGLSNEFYGNIQKPATDSKKSDLGRLIFFDKGLGLHGSNSCAGCHSPTTGWGDTQPIAIGIRSNDIVGPGRKGERNQRRTPTIANTAFYPKLMWNGRFSVNSGNPFDNSAGFTFPTPEGTTLFEPGSKQITHLLVAQAHIPFTESPEMAGFTGTCNVPFILPRFQRIQRPQIASLAGGGQRNVTMNSRSVGGGGGLTPLATPASPPLVPPELEANTCQFQDNQVHHVPIKWPAHDGKSFNSPIRDKVLDIINRMSDYRNRFSESFQQVADGNAIEFWMIGDVLAQFQMDQTFANAPIDKFARGDDTALTGQERKGAILFFREGAGTGNCVSCHATKGRSSQMFSDFSNHVAGIPQIYPRFGWGTGNVPFKRPDGNIATDGTEDLGMGDLFDPPDLTTFYKFRTSPLRNLVLQPFLFHNGAFSQAKLEDAVRYHIDPTNQIKSYVPKNAGVPDDLLFSSATMPLVIQRLDSRLRSPPPYSAQDISAIAAFLTTGLLDENAKRDKLVPKIPSSVPSKVPLQTFE